MRARLPHLARPLYESLPGLYILCGLLALAASYRERSMLASLALGIPGLVALLAGVVVYLRRRGYRRLRDRYTQPDALADEARRRIARGS
ncbi:MAG TPA: hypothetical protein VMU67_00120 [Steroidobacteraceae bacterium]|nr:hypothetical protein [Steroidobacteraceae bacterium]